MAHAGRRYEFPDGSLYELLEPAADTGGARTTVRVILPPTTVTLRPHIHPRQVEVCTVEGGRLDVLVGREWRRLEAGEELAVQPGQVHTFRNSSGDLVQFRVIHQPSLGSERYLERVYWLSAMNRIRDGRSVSSLLYRALVWDSHRDDQVAAGWMERVGVRVLAGIARVLRFRIDREGS
jgi:mannose-6-phosphate isomerase-like protein (cupin superfamily)